MTWRISKRFEFSASHVLRGLPEGHQCGRLHGHNYAVEVELEDDVLDQIGFVSDYACLDPVKVWLSAMFDHRHLNDCMINNPTAENLAQFIYDAQKDLYGQLSAVRVYETPKTCVEYRP